MKKQELISRLHEKEGKKKSSNFIATAASKLLCIWWRLVCGWSSIAIIISTITSLASIRNSGPITSGTHVVHREWVMLLRKCSRTLTVGNTIARSIRSCIGTIIHTLARIVVWPRISCSRAMLCRRSRVPPAERREGITKFGRFGWTERRWSTAPATTRTISSLVLRLAGTCWTLFPFCFGFLQMSSPLPQTIKWELWFELVVFYTFDDGSNGIQLQSAWLLLKTLI